MKKCQQNCHHPIKLKNMWQNAYSKFPTCVSYCLLLFNEMQLDLFGTDMRLKEKRAAHSTPYRPTVIEWGTKLFFQPILICTFGAPDAFKRYAESMPLKKVVILRRIEVLAKPGCHGNINQSTRVPQGAFEFTACSRIRGLHFCVNQCR